MWKPEVNAESISSWSPPYSFLRQSLSLNLELASLAGLAGQRVIGPFCLQPQCWDPRAYCCVWLLYVSAGVWTQVLECLHSECLTDGVISVAHVFLRPYYWLHDFSWTFITKSWVLVMVRFPSPQNSVSSLGVCWAISTLYLSWCPSKVMFSGTWTYS